MSLTERMPALVGVITLAAGALLAAAPQLTTKPLGLEGQETPVRLVGLADLALVPGLLRGEPRWPWMVGRAALNLGQAAYFLGVADRSSSPQVVLPIGVAWGFQPVAALRESGAETIVHSYAALQPVLDRFLDGASPQVVRGIGSGLAALTLADGATGLALRRG